MDVMLLLVPLGVPGLAATMYLVLGWRRGTWWIGTAAAAAALAASLGLAGRVLGPGAPATVPGLLRADAPAGYLLVVIGAIGLLATSASPSWLRAEVRAGRATARTCARHSALVQLFLAAMALAVSASNLGVVWVAIEATTIITAFLVGQSRTRAGVEAAWKYVVICSTGIALALLGVMLLSYAAANAPVPTGLDWSTLLAAAPRLDPGVTRIAVTMLIVGFGTKAGLAPMHAWLPDAHGQAPAPVSALMSGVLLSVAFATILRVRAVSDAALGAGFARVLLTLLALVSLLLAASLLIRQRDFKRMLAYSSIEHMGLLALGAAAGGPLALAAVLLHMLGHGLSKGTLFLAAGRMLQLSGTSRIRRLAGLAARAPVLAGCVGFGTLALLGLPPFSTFASEIGILRAGYATGLGWATSAAVALLVVISAALLTHTSTIVLGDGDPPSEERTAGRPASGLVPLVVALLLCAALGITTGPLAALLRVAAHTLAGTS